MADQSILVNKTIKEGDYVVAIQAIKDIEINSVGLVQKVLGNKIVVFFIGKQKSISTNSKQIACLDISKTGKPFKKKICNICHKLKDDLIDFAPNQNDKKGRITTRPSCKSCRVNIDKEKFLSTEIKKMNAIKPKGLFSCPICGKTSIPFKTASLVRDHDHNTGKAREWICDSCNTGLGRFKDDIKLLQTAIEYLKKYS